MTEHQLLQRIEALEREVAELRERTTPEKIIEVVWNTPVPIVQEEEVATMPASMGEVKP